MHLAIAAAVRVGVNGYQVVRLVLQWLNSREIEKFLTWPIAERVLYRRHSATWSCGCVSSVIWGGKQNAHDFCWGMPNYPVD